MPRSDPSYACRACRCQPWLMGLVLLTGCAVFRTDVQETLARRVMPLEVAAIRPTSRPESKSDAKATKDATVRPAAVSQLPPALEAPPPQVDAARPSASPAASLPSDSDEAALDAIAATGRPLTLPEAIDLAFRFQPRLRAQLETIAQARGQQQIAFSTFLPTVAGHYDVGVFNLGVGGAPIPLGKGLPGFNFVPGAGALPVGLSIGTTFEIAELKVQWLLLDFGRRLGRFEQARLASDVAGLQTDRAFQTVANEVAIAFYNVLRSQALRRTAQDALRRAEEDLTDARKREREGVVEREIVLRSEVQRSENLQLLHAATEAEFVALAELNLAIGLKSDEPVHVAEPHEIPPLATSLADCLQTAVRERREFAVARRTVEIAAEGGRVARAEFAPKVIADGTLLNFEQQSHDGHFDLRLGFIRLDWTLFEGGRKIAAARVADSQLRQAMAQAESIADNIAFQVNQAYRNAVTAWIGIEDARPAVDQASENYRLVQLRLREGAATPAEITDAQASLTRAQQYYLNARYSYLIAMERLGYAMGVSQTPNTHGRTCP
jgi:outer membrane protein TolC